MELYDELAEMTLELISEFGLELTLKRTIAGEYDTETGRDGPDTVQSQPIRAIVKPASQGTIQAFDQKFASGTLIESNIRALKMAAKGMLWPPTPGDTVILAGQAWRLIGATPVSPAGIDLLYSVTVMR